MFSEALNKTTPGISSQEYSKWGYDRRENPTVPFHHFFLPPGRDYTFRSLLKNCVFWYKLSLEKFVAFMFYVFSHLSNINILLQIYFKLSFISHFISLEIQFYNMTDYIAVLACHFRWEAIKITSTFRVLVSFTTCYVKPLKFLNFHNHYCTMTTLMSHVMFWIP